ncbi:hypothetical protein VN0532_00860 [Helicobacter pylori]
MKYKRLMAHGLKTIKILKNRNHTAILGVKNYLILVIKMGLLNFKKRAMVFGVRIEKCMNYVQLIIKNYRLSIVKVGMRILI